MGTKMNHLSKQKCEPNYKDKQLLKIIPENILVAHHFQRSRFYI